MFQQEIDRQQGYRPGVGLLLIHDGRILLGRGASYLTTFRFEGEDITLEQQEAWKFAWDLPQGGIEEGESFERAFARETCEELGGDWELKSVPRLFRREQMDFPVKKDGHTYRGKTYYYHIVNSVGTPEGFTDWVYGPHMDEGPYSYPTPEFPGGVKFHGHRDARELIMNSRNSRKGQLVLSILDNLRSERWIRP